MSSFPSSPSARARARPPVVIAHRGASGYLPEHTLAAYAVAMLQGADFIEPDLVPTRDGHLVARHDNVLDLTTDVAAWPEFSDRRTTKTVDGAPHTGWFSEDFTLAEIKRLRAVERIPEVRPANTRFDGQFPIPTLEEIIALVQAHERALGRAFGIYPETKHPTYFAERGLALEARLVEVLHAHGYTGRNDRVYIQSFEIGNLEKLRRLTQLPLVQLLAPGGRPYDVQTAGRGPTYDEMASDAGLAAIATYADAVGPEKNYFILPLDAAGGLDLRKATDFVRRAHRHGLQVHPYTFRAENRFLPASHRAGRDPAAPGDARAELEAFLSLGIDGFFIDQPDIGARVRDARAPAAGPGRPSEGSEPVD